MVLNFWRCVCFFIILYFFADAVYDGSISFPTSFNTSKTPPTFSNVPHYVIVVFVLAIAVTFSVLVTIGEFYIDLATMFICI